MVDLVGRACCQYSDAFENCDHKFRVQTCLQEGIKRSLLDNLIEFVKLDLFTDSTRNPHPQIVHLGPQQPITHSRDSYEEAKETDEPGIPMMDEACAAFVSIFIIIVSIGWLGQIADRPRKDGKKKHKLLISLLDLLGDGLVDSFLSKSDTDNDHADNCDDCIADCNHLVQMKVHF